MKSHALLFLVILTACGESKKEQQGGEETGDPDVQDSDPPATEHSPSLSVSYDPLVLTDLAWEAVALTPDWLQDDLAINMAKLDSDLQDELAAYIVDIDDHYMIDELAFAMAHTSPEVLDYRSFYPELFLINAEYIYLADEQLEYVTLDDVGEPGVDEGYYTTATYRTTDEDGETIVERTIDKELYYWDVVHPRLEDEWPAFVDGWDSDDETSPDEGYFWREFFWDRAVEECPEDRDCPIMDGWFEGVDLLWKNLHSTYEEGADSAIGMTSAFVWSAINWGAGSERPVQPVRIYVVGCGNCGEHADMASAAARTALIPAVNAAAWSNDHTWDEFWDDRWVHWDVTGSGLDNPGYGGGVSRDLLDNDCDGTADFGDGEDDNDGDGYATADGDCNDQDAAILPEAKELQNGYDDDCDGEADEDFVDSELDGDGDGYSIADGDCDDTDETRHPTAKEEDDLQDDDCDGVAEDGTDISDSDADGWAVVDGDCDDNDAAVNPDAAETNDARDENCDGEADEGFDGHDRDGDGYTMAEGDCNDLSSSYQPAASDPGLSSNILFAISTTRGDTHISTERTEDYGTYPSYLEFTVLDDDDQPVDGAVVTIYGTWAVYGYPEYLAWASEIVTDIDGYAVATVGEANPYYFDVVSDIGRTPGEGYASLAVSQSVAWQTHSLTIDNLGDLTDPPQPSLAKPPPEDAITALLGFNVQVESYRVEADGAFWGSMSLEHDDGYLDVFVVDDENLLSLADGKSFEAAYLDQDAQSSAGRVELPLNRPWYLVLANLDTLASTVVGSFQVHAEAANDADWTSQPDPIEQRFRIPPGEYLSVELSN